MCSHEQRHDLHGLRGHREPQQPTVYGDGEEAQQGIGQGMLPEQGALVHIHDHAHDKGGADTHAPRLMHVPEHQRHGQEIGQGRRTPHGHEVAHEGQQEREPHEQRVHGQQQLIATRHHAHGLPPLLPLAELPFGPEATSAAEARGVDSTGRSGSCSDSGCSTSTWRGLSGKLMPSMPFQKQCVGQERVYKTLINRLAHSCF